MISIPIPYNFDGSKFAKKYNLSTFEFYSDGVNLICPSLDNLTSEDLVDCIADPPLTRINPSQQIILANGEDIAILTFRGEPGATVDYTVNGQAQSLTLDEAGTDTLELSCDTPNTTLLVQVGSARAVIFAVEVPS